MTREQQMTASVFTHTAKRKYSHDVWKNRQAEYQKMKEQDCYGVQKGGKANGLDSD